MVYHHLKKYGASNRKVVILLHGWGIKERVVAPVGWLLAAAGYYCLSYTYKSEMLTPNLTKTVKQLHKAQKEIEQTLLQLAKQNYTDINIFGTSLGAIIGLMVVHSTRVPINKVIFNVPGINVAKSLWKWTHIVPWFGQELIKRYPTYSQLSKATRTIEPLKYIQGLYGKKVMLLIAKDDDMVYCPKEKLYKIMCQFNLNPVIKVNPFKGHLISGALNLLNFPTYITFLKWY